MSFKPFNFIYTPPPTVPTPAPAPTAVVSSTSTGSITPATSGVASAAGVLIAALNDLTVMSQYLQDAIVSITGKTAIEIDPAVDPITAQALASIYGTDEPPSFITVAMYDHMLDARMGALQLDMAVGNNSPIQPNPFDVGNISTAVNAVNKALVNSPSFNNYLPLQLSSLKADSIVFQSLAAALSTYPAYYTITPLASSMPLPTTLPASTVDVNKSLASYLTNVTNRFSVVYTSTYKSMATPPAAAQDASDIMGVFFAQPLSTMVQVSAMLSSLSALAHKPSMDNLNGDLINFTYARTSSDAGSMLVNLDQLVSTIVSPLAAGAQTSLTNLLTAAQGQKIAAGTVSSGALAGMSKANSSATANPANKAVPSQPLSVPGLGTASEGLKQMAETINWAQDQMTGNLTLLDVSFRQMTERRLSNANETQSLMGNLQSLDTISGIATGVVSELQKGTITANPSPQQQQEAASRILISLQTGSNSTFTTSGDQIIVNPPTMPPITPPVQRVLAKAGVIPTSGAIRSSVL